jgi:SAM-dependent methyltransferase
MYPCDEDEQDRLDMFHKLLSEARRGRLHSAPISSAASTVNGPACEGPRILDLGCGTGIWAIDIAKQYLNAEVLGVDLVSMQPPNRPRNCEFQAPRDYESPWWCLGEDSWDLIHLQMGCGSVSNWLNLYRKIFAHLRPGTGYFEQVEIDFEPRADNIILTDQPLDRWYHHLKEATERATKPIAFNLNTEHMLKAAGFVDIRHELVGLPLNTWSPDPHDKRVGRWYNLAFSKSVFSLSLGPLSRVSNWPVEKIKALAEEVESQAYNKEIHAFNFLHIFTARRPGPEDK